MSNSIKVKPEELGAVITQALKEYQQEVADDMKATCLKCAEIGASDLKVTSPYRRHKKGTKGGHYRSGWDVSVLYESNSTIRVAIHNKKKPGLVHMLRCCQMGISLRDLDLLTVGMVNDMAIERENDDYKWPIKATQADINKFFG